MKTTDFAMLVNQFIMEYLVAARDLSPNTVLSYRDSIVLLITFMSNVHGKRPEALEIADITAERVEEFLGWLESERTNSPSTKKYKACSNPLPVQVPLQPAGRNIYFIPSRYCPYL